MSPGNMSHGGALAFYGHPENRVNTFEHKQKRTLAGFVCVRENKI